VQLPDVSEEGAIAVSKKIMDPLQNLPDQPITISVDKDENVVRMTCSAGKYDFPYCAADEFPVIPKDEGTTQFALSVDTLNEGINRTLFAVGNDDMRPAMNGVYFDIHNDNLVFVATDAHKLVRYTRNDVKAGTESSFILPKKSAGVLKAILARETDEASVSFNNESVSFSFASYRLACRLIEGTFPAYNSVIPTENPNKATINRTDLLTVVKRISTVAPAETLLVKFAFAANQVNVSAQDVGFSYKGEEHLSCAYEGEEVTIGFKAAYLSEMLQTMTASEVTIAMSQPDRAGLILPVEEDDNEETLMLLMPIRLDDSY
jgi:DNA polymerase-3 subunit beta